MRKKIATVMSLLMLLTACSSPSPVVSSTTAPASEAAKSSQNETGPGNTKEIAETQWPTGDVTAVVAASAGGGTDIQARIVAEYFRKYTGHNLIIENQASGSGTVAYEQVRNAKPDGNTLLYYHSSMYIAYYSGIYEHPILESFTPIAKTTESLGNAICVPASSPYQTLDQLVKAAKASPETIVAGIQIGGFPEYLIRLLEKDGQCIFKKVDAGNASDRLTSLLGGHIDVACINGTNAVEYEESGDLRVLGICSKERVEDYPDWIPVGETDYPNVVIPNGQFFYAPAGTDQELARAMNKVFVQILEDPEYQEATKANGVIPDGSYDFDGVQEKAAESENAIRTVFEGV